MQRIHTRLSWLSSLRSFRIGAILMLVMQIAFASQQAIISAIEPDTTAAAQSVVASQPTVAESAPVTTPAASQEPQQTQQTAPAQTPPATPVKTQAVATTPAAAYNKVSIPSIGFSSQFVTVGLTADHAIDVNPKLVGWWNGSAQPGQDGAVFLDGHVTGIFKTLPRVNIGDDVTITMASGATYNYTVVYRETVALENVDMKKALTVYGGGAQGLNLMTCAGTYSDEIKTNTERLVVYAVRS
jgi:sortase (surface protein transpeptidase)